MFDPTILQFSTNVRRGAARWLTQGPAAVGLPSLGRARTTVRFRALIMRAPTEAMDRDRHAAIPPLPSHGQAPGSTRTRTDAARHALPLRLMLSFTPAPLERRFVEDYVATYYRYAQAALALGVLLVVGDFFVDWLAHRELVANWMRLTLAVPVLAAGLGYTFLPGARTHWQAVLAGFVVAVACSLFWILLRVDAEGGPGLSSWVGILNFTFLEFYCFVILGVQFRVALISGLLILAAFGAALVQHPAQMGSAMPYWTYHVVTLFMLSAGVGWWREFLLRKDFATRIALDESREEACAWLGPRASSWPR